MTRERRRKGEEGNRREWRIIGGGAEEGGNSAIQERAVEEAGGPFQGTAHTVEKRLGRRATGVVLGLLLSSYSLCHLPHHHGQGRRFWACQWPPYRAACLHWLPLTYGISSNICILLWDSVGRKS